MLDAQEERCNLEASAMATEHGSAIVATLPSGKRLRRIELAPDRVTGNSRRR